MSGQRHPDTETLASWRAGLVGGLRGRRLAAHVARCARCAATGDELAAVSSFLASAPTPPLPESFEQRITAALAAEASARSATASERAASEPARVPAGRRPPASSRRRVPSFRLRPAMVFVPVVICLLAGFGFLLSTISKPAGSSSSEAFTSTSPSAAPAAGSRAAPAIEQPATFLVTASGMNYLPRTLSAQVRLEMTVQYSSGSGRQAMASSPGGSTPSPGGSTSQSAAGPTGAGAAGSIPAGFAAPSSVLNGCVLRVTSGVRPTLVDKATYQGTPVYVIAVPERAWVVGRGCTASNPALITSVALAGAR